MKKTFVFVLSLLAFLGYAQENELDSITDNDFLVVDTDSITFSLDEVLVFKNLKFDNSKEKRYYYWYYKKVHKAYPYAKLASEKLLELNNELAKIRSKRKRKKHTKKMQKYMEEEFTAELKKMTRTEGKVLIKLLHRQTGLTAFDLVKEYRSGWKAFWYNSTANLFKLSLKSEYHPEKEQLDFLVEDILQRSFAKGTLEEQQARLPIDYLKISKNYKNIDIVSVIDNRNKKK